MADSNMQTLDTVKPITLDEYQKRTAHLQENTTSLLSAISDRQVQAAGLATQAASLASEVNAVAEQARLSFSKKTWTDNATSGTPITAAELNRLENAISSLTTAVNNLKDSVHASVLSTETMTKGSAIHIPDLYKWMVIGVCVPVDAGNESQPIIVPCSVLSNFVSGSLGYIYGPDSSLVTVSMHIRSTGLNYDDCTVQKVGYYDGVVSRNPPIEGIIGLIRTDPRLLE